jgi:SAM-dependent methyltransferase
MMRILDLTYRLAPGVGLAVTRAWYHYISRLDKSARMVFMNYGYAHLDPAVPEPVLHEMDESDRYCIQLYHHLAGAVDIAGRDVMEIGCGRGGGASYIARYLKPGTMTGMDIAAEAIDFCNRHYREDGLAFRHGDAEALPFPDHSFDVIINIESSHCYASMRRFLSGVHRCLRPNGLFLFADRRDRRQVEVLRRQLKSGGFEELRMQNISANILGALDLDDRRKLALIDDGVPWLFRKLFKQFAAVRGTSLYRSFQNQNWEYLSFILRKSDPAWNTSASASAEPAS